MTARRWIRYALVAVLLPLVVATAPAQAAPGPPGLPGSHAGLDAAQRATLQQIARDTWRFFVADTDPVTHLPLDNLGPGRLRGHYTSAANIGVYLWAIVAAHDMRIIGRRRAVAMADATLRTVAHMTRSHGFLHQWYDTDDGSLIRDPGTFESCTGATPAIGDNCFFLSAVDNGWYASGLTVVKHALPEVGLASRLLRPMDFSIFYDDRPQNGCNVNSTLPGSPATGHQYGGYYVGVGPAPYHSDVLYSDPRIATYFGLGRGQMPGGVWWTTWRTLPPKRCATDPDFSFQGQPPQGYWTTVRDPRTHRRFRVWEGHYTYPGTGQHFLPTFNGGMFEALMADEVVPEARWGPQGLGLATKRTVQVQIRYARRELGYPVWGLSPSATSDGRGYNAFGVQGLHFPMGQRLAQGPCADSPTCPEVESTVTPHASFLALDVAPQQAYANIERLRTLYPRVYSRGGGFFDAVNPTTGEVGRRRLVLDQSMIMAGLDNVLEHGRLQHWFAADRVGQVARLYLGAERMSLR